MLLHLLPQRGRDRAIERELQGKVARKLHPMPWEMKNETPPDRLGLSRDCDSKGMDSDLAMGRRSEVSPCTEREQANPSEASVGKGLVFLVPSVSRSVFARCTRFPTSVSAGEFAVLPQIDHASPVRVLAVICAMSGSATV